MIISKNKLNHLSLSRNKIIFIAQGFLLFINQSCIEYFNFNLDYLNDQCTLNMVNIENKKYVLDII